ncbi:unnamed protein product [Lepidochelys kempii]
MQCQVQRRAPFSPLQQAEAEKLIQALCACFHSPPGLFSKLRSPPPTFRRSLLSDPHSPWGTSHGPNTARGKGCVTWAIPAPLSVGAVPVFSHFPSPSSVTSWEEEEEEETKFSYASLLGHHHHSNRICLGWLCRPWFLHNSASRPARSRCKGGRDTLKGGLQDHLVA